LAGEWHEAGDMNGLHERRKRCMRCQMKRKVAGASGFPAGAIVWLALCWLAAAGTVSITQAGIPDSMTNGGPADSPTQMPARNWSLSDSLTISDAIHLALTSHPAVLQAEMGMVAAGERVGTSRSQYYPDISLSGAYTRIGPVPEFTVGPGESEKMAPENNYDLHLGLRQTLFDFGRTSTSVALAQAGHQTASDYAGQVKSNLAYRTISAFNAILILGRSVEVLDEEISALEQHREVSRKRVQAGTATDFDVLTTEVRIAAARNDRIDAANNLEAQQITLRQLADLPEDKPVHLKGDFTRTAAPLDSAFLLEEAFGQRPELVLCRDGEAAAILQARLSGLGNRPSFAFNVTSGLRNGYFPNLDQLKADYSAGLQLQFALFNGGRTHHQQAEAEAGLLAARARTEDVKRQVASEVTQAISAVRATWERTQNAEVLVKQAEEAVSMAEVKYQAGVVTNLDLLDAQTTLTQARLVRLRALYAYTMSLVELDRATGKKVW
jgi:outer membrane protein